MSVQHISDHDQLPEIRERLHECGNVYQTGIGYRFRDGEQTDEACVIAYVEAKEDYPDDPIPREVHGVQIDVIEAPKDGNDLDSSDNYSGRRDRIRPLMGGARVNGYGTGTLGFPVVTSDGNDGVLAADHLVRDENDNHLTDIYQPREDTEESDDNIIGSPGEYDESEDWVIIETNSGIDVTGHALGIGQIDAVADPPINQRVVFSTSEHGLLGGTVVAKEIDFNRRDYDVQIDDDKPDNMGGTSGSGLYWIDDNGNVNVCGILVSDSGGERTWATSAIEAQNETGFTLPSNPPTYSEPDSGSFFEGTITNVNQSATPIQVWVTNLGGTLEDATIILTDSSGDVVDGERITDVDSGEIRQLDFHAGSDTEVTISCGDTGASDWQVDLSNQISLGDVDLSWIDNATIEEEYRIYRSEVANPEYPRDFEQIATKDSDTTTHTDTDAPYSTDVTYAVTAWESGNGETSPTTTTVDTTAVSVSESVTIGSLLSTSTTSSIGIDETALNATNVSPLSSVHSAGSEATSIVVDGLVTADEFASSSNSVTRLTSTSQTAIESGSAAVTSTSHATSSQSTLETALSDDSTDLFVTFDPRSLAGNAVAEAVSLVTSTSFDVEEILAVNESPSLTLAFDSGVTEQAGSIDESGLTATPTHTSNAVGTASVDPSLDVFIDTVTDEHGATSDDASLAVTIVSASTPSVSVSESADTAITFEVSTVERLVDALDEVELQSIRSIEISLESLRSIESEMESEI